MTCFDSKRVERAMGERDVLSLCDDALRLERRTGGKDSRFGREVCVKVDTIGSHSEYLVDTEWLASSGALKGFEHVKTLPFRDFFLQSSSRRGGRRGRVVEMSDDIKTFSFLNVAMVFRRVKCDDEKA